MTEERVTCCSCRWLRIGGTMESDSCSPRSLPKKEWSFMNGWCRPILMPCNQNECGDCRFWQPNLLTRILNFFRRKNENTSSV